MKAKSTFAVPLFFTIIWSVVTLGFDAGIVYLLFWNVRSYWYVETNGTITHSRLATSQDSEGDTSYRPEIEYDYEIGGQMRHGTKRRFGEMSISGSGVRQTVQRILDRYPVGAKTSVYYDPRHPDWTVLEPGLNGMDFFIVLFLTPFNLVMLLLLFGWSRMLPTDEEGLLKGLVTETARGWEIRERTSAIGGFFAGVGAAAFLMIFVVAFGIGLNPSLGTMGIVWSLVLLLGTIIAVAIAGAPKGAVIDVLSQDVILRGWFGGTKATLSHSQLQGVICHHKVGDSETPDSYDVQLQYHDEFGQPQAASIYTSQQPERPRTLVKWLREKLRLENNPAEAIDHEASDT